MIKQDIIKAREQLAAREVMEKGPHLCTNLQSYS